MSLKLPFRQGHSSPFACCSGPSAHLEDVLRTLPPLRRVPGVRVLPLARGPRPGARPERRRRKPTACGADAVLGGEDEGVARLQVHQAVAGRVGQRQLLGEVGEPARG